MSNNLQMFTAKDGNGAKFELVVTEDCVPTMLQRRKGCNNIHSKITMTLDAIPYYTVAIQVHTQKK